jgi:hypothetical protein
MMSKFETSDFLRDCQYSIENVNFITPNVAQSGKKILCPKN